MLIDWKRLVKKCSQSRQPEGRWSPWEQKVMWERRAWLSPRKSGVYDIIKTGGAFNNNGFGKISLRGTDKLYLLSTNRTCQTQRWIRQRNAPLGCRKSKNGLYWGFLSFVHSTLSGKIHRQSYVLSRMVINVINLPCRVLLGPVLWQFFQGLMQLTFKL